MKKIERNAEAYFRTKHSFVYKSIPFPVTDEQAAILAKNEVFKFAHDSRTYFVVPGRSTKEEGFTTITLPLMPGIQKSMYFRFAAMFVEEMYYWDVLYRNSNDFIRAAIETGGSAAHLAKMAKELGLIGVQNRRPHYDPVIRRMRKSLKFKTKKPKRKKKKIVKLSF